MTWVVIIVLVAITTAVIISSRSQNKQENINQELVQAQLVAALAYQKVQALQNQSN